MARTRSRNWVISSPGRLPDQAVIFDLPTGAVLRLASVAISSSIPSLLSGANAELNVADYTDANGDVHTAGTVLFFDVIALQDIAPLNSDQTTWDEADAYRLYITASTDDSPDEQTLTYEKVVEVYTRIPLV